MLNNIKQIIIITQDFYPSSDGISTWCRELAKELINNKFKIIVITKSYDGNSHPLNIPLKELGEIPVLRLDHKNWKSSKYRKLTVAIKPYVSKDTLFLCANWKMGIPCRLISFIKKINYIVAVHGLDAIVKRFSQAIQQKSVFYHTKGFFSVSKYTAGLLRHIDFKKTPFTIIPNGVDTNIFKKEAPSGEILQRYNIQPGNRILSLGRLVARKGFDITIKALPLMKTQHVTYYIAGTGSYEKELKKLVSDLNLGHQVYFLGYIPEQDICGLYNIADVFCMPSRNNQGNVEGFGITYIEAGACEIPSIGGKNSGAEDAIENGITGILVDPESPEEIAKVLDELFLYPEKRLEMGRNARERIYRSFTWDKVTSSFIEFSDRCVSSPLLSKKMYNDVR